jgi:hypothetical protein
VHYAATTEPICFDESVTKIVEEFKNDSVDFHKTVAIMAGISRNKLKQLTLDYFMNGKS